MTKKMKRKTTRFSSSKSVATQNIYNDLFNFKIQTGHKLIDLENSLSESKKDLLKITKYLAAFLDLLSEISNIPGPILINRFIQFCQDHEVVTSDGNIRGEADIMVYNIGGQL